MTRALSRVTAGSLACIGLLLVLGCAKKPEPPSVIDQGRSVARVFETAHPYSKRMIDSTDLARLFEQHHVSAADSGAIIDFYQRRDMLYAWIVGDSLTASAESFIDLANGGEGVAPTDTGTASRLTAIHDSAHALAERGVACASCLADLELELTAEFYRFADRRYNGYLSRDMRDLNWFIPHGKKDLTKLLDSLAVGQLDLSAYEPMHPQYQLLKAAIGRYQLLRGDAWPALALPAGKKKLVAGDSNAVIGEIGNRLRRLGDLDSATVGDRLDSAFVAGVKRFQDRHGLQPDGVIGAGFLRAVNVTPEARLRTMAINIERLRWVPEQQPPDLILVNIPEFRLHVFEGDSQVMQMAVVVGARATHTVVFSDTLSTVVFSPSWTVPASITRNEILPAIRRDPDYLRKHNMVIIGGSKTLPVVRQNPGPDNSLGRVKFLFPNSYDIYMHDTPAKSLFSADQRAFSHGCIRVSEPQKLAEFLLADDSTWTTDRIESAMASGREQPVPLKHKRPVQIVYFTAWVDAQGRVNFRDDVYGHDAQLADELFVER